MCFFFKFFQLLEKNPVAKIMPSVYLCVIIHVEQLPFLAVLTLFLILGKIQDGDKDGDHCW